MEIKVKHVPIIVVSVLVLFGLGIMMPTGTAETGLANSNGVEYHSGVCVGSTIDGEYVDFGCQENTLTDVGKELIEDWINSANASEIDVIVLGNTTVPATGSTTHPGKIADCGLSEHTTTVWSDVGTGNQSTTQLRLF